MTEDYSPDMLDRRPTRRDVQRGFNLTELLIGIAIISMALLFLIPSMGSWMQSTRIRNAAESIKNALRLTRAEAVGRNTSVQLVFPSLASGGTDMDWVVSCVNTVANANCPGPAITMSTASTTYIQRMSAAEGAAGVQVATTPSVSAITFSGMGRNTAAADITLDITNPVGGTCAASGGKMRCLRIVVTTSGQVRMCDPALPNTNPRGC